MLSNKPLTPDELETLIQDCDTTFCLSEVTYRCNLYYMPLSQVTEWLISISRYREGEKKQTDKANALRRWLALAQKYKKVVDLFYPQTVERIPNVLNKHIINSDCLNSQTLQECKDKLRSYWLERTHLNPYKLKLSEIIDIGRAVIKLDIHVDRYKEFNLLFDVEFNFGRGSDCSFNSLFTFLRKASLDPDWSYRRQEWPLIQNAISNWRSWYLCTTHTFVYAECILEKYLDIPYVHKFFRHAIWEAPGSTLDIDSEYLQPDYNCTSWLEDNLLVDYLRHFETLGIDTKATEVEARAKYRQLAKQYHPDHLQGVQTEEITTINESWECLQKYYQQKKQYEFTRRTNL